jgi:tRNA U34 2-thiouridine synthase MnmA/TrmU
MSLRLGRAVGLISGGLDSVLAAKVIKLQGIDVMGITFVTPFVHPQVEKLAHNIGIKINVIDISLEYLDLIKNPYFGFGKNFNPCIDCHIFMLKKAKQFMLKQAMDFVITGEVLGQRPMSQNKSALRRIESQSGLEGLLLRPLSARLLSSTIPEQKGWVKRDELFDFSGRSRKPQLELTRQLGLEGFSQPAGGCLLTDPGFSRRLKDLMTYQREFSLDDVNLLKLGRHFRLSDNAKLVLGRNQVENQRLVNFLRAGDFLLQPIDIPGPTGILKSGINSQDLLNLSAGILANFCDKGNSQPNIAVQNGKGREVIDYTSLDKKYIHRLWIQ